MPTNMSDDWRENGPTEDREFDENDEEIEPEHCESCGKKIIAGCCACAEADE